MKKKNWAVTVSSHLLWVFTSKVQYIVTFKFQCVRILGHWRNTWFRISTWLLTCHGVYVYTIISYKMARIASKCLPVSNKWINISAILFLEVNRQNDKREWEIIANNFTDKNNGCEFDNWPKCSGIIIIKWVNYMELPKVWLKNLFSLLMTLITFFNL